MKNSTKILCVLLSLIMALSVFTVLPVGVSAAEADTATSAYNSDNDYSRISYGTVYNPSDSYTVDANTPYTEDAIIACGGLLSDTQKIYFQAPEDWANQYNTFEGPDSDEPYMHICIYWWGGIGSKWPNGTGVTWVGYQAHLVDKKNRIYRALVPNDGETPLVIWNNGVNGGMDPTKEIFLYGRQLADANIEGAYRGDYDTLPEGTPNEDNMDGCIQIINYDPDLAQENPLTHCWIYGSDWYVYYGDGCYGEYPTTSPNFHGQYASCVNPDHNNHQCFHDNITTYKENYQDYGDHSSYDLVTYCSDCGQELNREHKEVQYPTGDGVIYFDATSAGWENASKIMFYIYDIEEGYGLADWGSRKLSGTYVGNGKWAYDAAGVGVEPGKQYGLIMYNYDTRAQCYDLVMDSSCFGDTAYVTGKSIKNPVDSNKSSMEARWRNSRLGPRKQITSIGNVVGETVPVTTTPYKMFVGFLRNTLDNARYYSGKDDQRLIDDTAKALELNKNDVKKAIRETGAWVSWSYSDSTIPPPAPVDIPDEDGLILFDARSAGWEDADAIMFDIYDLNDNRLPAESTPDEIRGTESYDGVWFFNAKERGVQDGQLYYIIFWNDNTHEHTAQLLLDSSCYGDKAVCDGLMASEALVDYLPYSYTNGASSSGSSSRGYSSNSDNGTPYFDYPYYVSYPAVSWNNQHSFSANGTIGNLTWAIKNGVLTISGNGPLENDDKIKKIWDKLKFTKAVIQNGVTSIGDGVFDGCYSLESVTIGNAVTGIGERAFKDCKNLESISIGGSVKSISRYAFYRCVGLKTAVIGNSVTSIGNSAFYQCSDLTSVTIGNSVTKIDKYTFEDCDNLKNVTLGNSIYGIAAGAFYDCDNLESIVLPDSVQIIADKAFSDCISLSSVNIPEAVTDIGEKAFYNCPSLKNVTVPDSATNIDTKAFGYYYNNEFGITMRVPGFRLYGSVNSEAQRYTKAYGFQFERAIAMVGDADGDCQVTVMDVSEVQRTLSKVNTITEEDITEYVDIDQNNVINIIDATYILRSIANIPIPYEVGKIMDNQ